MNKFRAFGEEIYLNFAFCILHFAFCILHSALYMNLSNHIASSILIASFILCPTPSMRWNSI